MKYMLPLLFIFSTSLLAQQNTVDFGYLKDSDQQYYKNGIMEGNNQRERIDSLVKEVNKIYGEMASMKAEIQTLKSQVNDLQNKK